MARSTWIVAACLCAGPAMDAAAQRVAPSPLLAVDQHRASIVQGIVAGWRETLQQRSGTVAAEREADFAQALWRLRADRLLAASLAGSLAAVEALVADADGSGPHAPAAVHKALGDANADLTYTPINPCRIADTRIAGGALSASVPRTFDGFSANFATQGGTASNCGMPSGVAAIAMNVYAVNPTNLGFIKLWPANGAEPAVSTVNYQVGITAIATGAIVPVDAGNANRFTAKSPAGVDFIADVVGYFRAAGVANFFVQGGNAFGATGVVGTIDNQPLSLVVNGQPVMRYLPNSFSPNVVGGHSNNSAGPSAGQTIAGGGFAGNNCYNPISDALDGSCGNQTADSFATVSGGAGNSATGDSATVAGGAYGRASGVWSTVGGGKGNLASGFYATIPGGQLNVATGENSFAAGRGARADGDGCFLFANWSGGQQVGCGATQIARFALNHGMSFDYKSPTANGAGTRYVYIGDLSAGSTILAWNGASLTDGGIWQNASDRNGKENFADVDPQAVLARLVELPVTRWNHKTDPAVQRMGPMAQDFHAAFGLGPNDTTISSVDTAGVAYAAIQGLNAIVREKERQITALERAAGESKRKVAALEGAVEELKRAIAAVGARR